MTSKTRLTGALACAVIAAAHSTSPAAPFQSSGETTIQLELVGAFSAPMYVTHAPDEFNRLFVIERAGRVRIIRDGNTLPTPFLDITADVDTTLEGGLLGIAIDPHFESNGHIYLHYTRTNDEFSLTGVIERFTTSAADPDLADINTRHTILELPHFSNAHQGGWIGFGPHDDLLYIPFGDSDFDAAPQDITDQWHGKILRVDVQSDDFPKDPNRNYAIPADNPFVGIEGDDEIYALGLRNPFRCGFDSATGDLYIGDVGDSQIEEVDVLDADDAHGVNFGWGCMEGSLCLGSHCTCNDPELELPVYEYDHSQGCAITGGTVYRGCAIPELNGTYFFSDFCTSRLWTFDYIDGAATNFMDRTPTPSTFSITSFSTDAYGEILITSLGGTIHKITSTTPPPDKNKNGIPDTCENTTQTPGDINNDNTVDVADLLLLLAAWGPCNTCPEDINNNGTVDVTDLLTLLANWS